MISTFPSSLSLLSSVFPFFFVSDSPHSFHPSLSLPSFSSLLVATVLRLECWTHYIRWRIDAF